MGRGEAELEPLGVAIADVALLQPLFVDRHFSSQQNGKSGFCRISTCSSQNDSEEGQTRALPHEGVVGK